MPIRGGGGGRSTANAGTDGGSQPAGSRPTSTRSSFEAQHAPQIEVIAPSAAGPSSVGPNVGGSVEMTRSASARMSTNTSVGLFEFNASINTDVASVVGSPMSATISVSTPQAGTLMQQVLNPEGSPDGVGAPPEFEWPTTPAATPVANVSLNSAYEVVDVSSPGSNWLTKKTRLKADRPDKLEVPIRSTGSTDGPASPGTAGGRQRGLEPVTPTFHMGARMSNQEVPSCSIRVVVRIRPSLPKERSEAQGVESLSDGKSVMLTDGEQKKQFTVDEVIDSRPNSPLDGSQTAVYNSVGRDLLTQSMKGYNVCLFAYGHTGSGKTYTVLGVSGGVCSDGEAAGLLPRFLSDIFRTNAQDPQRKELRYRAEFYEVHNEQIRDLLAPVGGHRRRAIHVHPTYGVRIDGLSSAVVASPEEALGLVNFGNQMRTVAATTMNERSSRSHAVFTLNFEYTKEEEQGKRSAVTFVDLAGREDWEATAGGRGEHYKEMCYINTSLFHLARLITKLSEGQVTKGSLADFRNSKLTLLLSQALIGNSRTALVATLAPLKSFYDDSVSTLNFAANVKKITTKPVINAKSGSALVKELEKEVFALRTQLNDAKTSSTEKEENLLAAQAMIQYYKTSFEELISQSEEQKQLRKSVTLKLGLPDTFEGDFSHPRTAGGQLVPFFTKLSDDPSLQGCCNYFLSRGVLVIGSDDSCDIMLHGVGIRPKMCEVKFDSASGTVTIQLLQSDSEDAPRVIVSGHPLKEGTHQVHMSHNDSLVLGYAHAFRLVDPENDPSLALIEGNGRLATSDLAQKLCPSLDMCTAVQDVFEETGCEFRKAYHYLQQFSARAPESAVQAFMHDLRIVCPLVDEANEIREQIYGRPDLRLELHCLTDFMDFANDAPELVVCTVQNFQSLPPLAKFKAGIKSVLTRHDRKGEDGESVGGSIGGDDVPPALLQRRRRVQRRDTSQLLGPARHPMVHELGLEGHMEVNRRSMLYVWSLEKFLRRLKEMRELYQEGCEAKDGFDSVRKHLESKPYLNPWREMTIGDVKLIAEDARCFSIMSGHQQVSRLSSDNKSKNGDETPRACLTPRGAAAEASPRAGVGVAVDATLTNVSSQHPFGGKPLVSPPLNSPAESVPAAHTIALPGESRLRVPAVTTADASTQAGGGEDVSLAATQPAVPTEGLLQASKAFSLAEAVKGAMETSGQETTGTGPCIAAAAFRRSRAFTFGARQSLSADGSRRVHLQGAEDLPSLPERPPTGGEDEASIEAGEPVATRTISVSTFGGSASSREVQPVSSRNNSKASSAGSKGEARSPAPSGLRQSAGREDNRARMQRPYSDARLSPRPTGDAAARVEPTAAAFSPRTVRLRELAALAAPAVGASQSTPKIKISQQDLEEIRRDLGACRLDALGVSDPEAGRLTILLDRFEKLLIALGIPCGTDDARPAQVAVLAPFSSPASPREDRVLRARSEGRCREPATMVWRAVSAGSPVTVRTRTLVSRSRSPPRVSYQVVQPPVQPPATPAPVQLPLSAAASAAALGHIVHRQVTPAMVVPTPPAKTPPAIGTVWPMVPIARSPESSFRQSSPQMSPTRSGGPAPFMWQAGVASVTSPPRKLASPTLLRPRRSAEAVVPPGGDSAMLQQAKLFLRRNSVATVKTTSSQLPATPTDSISEWPHTLSL